MPDDSRSVPRYESYLLRLRWVDADGKYAGVGSGAPKFVCQVMLQSILTRDTVYFSDLESCVAFLKEHGSGEGFSPAAEPESQG